MLVNLQIENIAVIERADIGFERGLTVMTGETGAGKSIIIDSLSAILGERTSKDLIRTGAQNAKIIAAFCNVTEKTQAAVEEVGAAAEPDGTLVLQRVLSADGRSLCRVNGSVVTVSGLRSVGTTLVNIHGQHDSQALLNADMHCGYLDLLADNGALLEEYRLLYHEMRAAEKRLAALTRDENDKNRRLEFFRYQIDELSAAEITEGETESLRREREKSRNSEKIKLLLHKTHDALSGSDEFPGSCGLLYDASDGLDELKKYYSELEQPSRQLRELLYIAEDCSGTVADILSSYEYDEVDLDRVEQRLDTLSRLSRKYGETERDMLDYLERISQEYDNINGSDEECANLRAEIDGLKRTLAKKAAVLSERRRESGEKFARAVSQQLENLDMPKVRFSVEQLETPPTADGADKIQFLIAVNAGESAKPLAKTASGGELSRIMLAIKTVLAGCDEIGTMIFDEIDAGVSGRAAGGIARMMREVAMNGQVICVTHLARIASYADNHLFIDKTTDGVTTKTRVTALDREQRAREIARIVGGEMITQAALDNANEMLKFAENDVKHNFGG